MKKLLKYVTPILIALISVTVLVTNTAIAANTKYEIEYKTKIETASGEDDLPLYNFEPDKENCTNSDNPEDVVDPKGCTAYATYNDYQFDKWVEEGTDTLPKGLYTENSGLTLKFDASIPDAKRVKRVFVAIYKYKDDNDKIIAFGPEQLVQEKPETTSIENPETGDNNSIVVWIIIGAVALAAVIAAIILLVSNKNKK